MADSPSSRQPLAGRAASGRTAGECLLLPVGGRLFPAPGIAYAEYMAQKGGEISVCLLHVEERLGLWASLRGLRTGDTTTRRNVEPILRAAGERLATAGIPHAIYLRSGDVVFQILDAAEQLNCSRIVVPLPDRHRLRFCRSTLAVLSERSRGIPVIAVAANGMPVRPRP